MRIFGREPTVIIQTIAALLSILVAFQLPGLSAEQAGAVTAAIWAVFGVLNALAVRPVAPAAFTGLVGTVAALTATYGLHFTQAQIGSVSAGLVAVIVLLTRGQSTPVADPRAADIVVG